MPDEIAKLKGKYAALTADESHRLLKLWAVRSVSNGGH